MINRIRYTSGHAEMDKIRNEVKHEATNTDTYELRSYMLKQWACALQQCGMYLDEFLEINMKYEDMQPRHAMSDFLEKLHVEDNGKNFFEVIDQSYAVLENIQERYHVKGADICITSEFPEVLDTDQNIEDVPWPMYQGSKQHIGSSKGKGPIMGQEAWKFPTGLAWYVHPVFNEGRMYISSPGMRTILYCIDCNTGNILWTTKQVQGPATSQLYSSAGNWSIPVILEKYVLIRMLGSLGKLGEAWYVYLIDKQNGEIVRKIGVSHMDYRAGWAPFVANEKYVYSLYSEQFITHSPPLGQSVNRVFCNDIETGEVCWEFNAGSMFADPVLHNDVLLVPTKLGTLFSIDTTATKKAKKVNTGKAIIPEIKWQFRAGAAINNAVLAIDDKVYFGANNGKLYCININTGEMVWEHDTGLTEPRAFKQFSKLIMKDDKLYVGSANKMTYCLDAKTGKVEWQKELSDWIRSTPTVCGNYLFVATMDAKMYRIPLNDNGNYDMCVDVGEHAILADLSQYNGEIYVSNSNMMLYRFDHNCEQNWSMSAIECYWSNDRRICTEQLAGGAYFQSKASAADGLVYFGGPSRFVHALDAQSGEEIWRFELGAAISACPSYDDGKIYVGQQGGEDEFYCLDAKTGEPVWTQCIGWTWGSANISEGRIYIPSIEGFVYCLDGKTGHIIWRFRTIQSVCTEPVNNDGMVCFGGWDHFLYSFNEEDGKLIWQFNMGVGSDSGAQLIKDDKIYVPAGGTRVRCIDANTAEILWEFEDKNASFNASLAYSNDHLFLSASYGMGLGGVATKTKIICIESKRGTKVWEHDDGGGLTCAAVADGKVYFGATSSPYIYCVDEKGNGDGTTKCYFRYMMENNVEEICPAIYNGMVYMLNTSGYFYAIK